MKKALSDSAAYPREFGMAIAGLLPSRGLRPPANEFSPGNFPDGPPGSTDLGALDDILKGSQKAWWRQYTSTS